MAQQKLNWKSLILYLMAVILWWTAGSAFLNLNSYNTPVALDITFAILLMLLVKLLGQFPLKSLSYFVLFPALFIIQVCYTWLSNFLTPFFLAFCVLALLFLQNQPVREYFIPLAFLEILTAVFGIGYTVLFRLLREAYYRLYKMNPHLKALLILSSGIVFLFVFIFLVQIFGKLLSKNQFLFQFASRKISGLELYIFLFVSLTTVSIGFVQQFHLFPDYILKYVSFFVLLSNIAYIFLIFHGISMKDKMSAIENEKNAVAAYNADLETSLVHMREIRHDVKNLFLTMGGFVEASGNDEMKQFYRENIIPFIQDTIIKNDLHDKLGNLPDEPLKSFFYYKLTEKISFGIHVKLEILAPVSIEIGSGDFIRLMGILIDNAAEEAALTPERNISVCISDDPSRNSFRISNSFRPESKKRGVIQGTTNKGLGRGNGLVIAGKIIAKYENVILNSYFNETEFVQNLSILKEQHKS